MVSCTRLRDEFKSYPLLTQIWLRELAKDKAHFMPCPRMIGVAEKRMPFSSKCLSLSVHAASMATMTRNKKSPSDGQIGRAPKSSNR